MDARTEEIRARVESDEFDDDDECKRCHATMTTHDGDDPTDYCDHCAQELVTALREEVERLKGAMQESATDLIKLRKTALTVARELNNAAALSPSPAQQEGK